MHAKKKILGVDDNPTNLAVLEEMLEEDYEFRTAATGEEALSIASEFRPELILLDVMMPGIDGYEVCRRLRADAVLRHAKIIMVSAKAMVSERMKGYEAGADDYVTKPFEQEELLAKVRVYLRLKSVEEIDRLKTDVLALLSHETRTPLIGLLGGIDVLMSADDLDAAEREKWLQIMRNCARSITNLIEKALTLSCMKSGKWKPSREYVDLCNVVRDATRQLAASAAERNVKISEGFGGGAMVSVDRKEITRMVTAMLDNAIRFSPSEETVTVEVSRDNGEVCLTVTDRGKGIEPDHVPYVFDELHDPKVSHHTQGHGMSLAIARHAVLGHEGTIRVESTKGSGATFEVRLPAVPESGGVEGWTNRF